MATSSPKLPLADKPGVGNWVERYHALPKSSWIRRTAEHLRGKGMPTGRAIAVAVNAARRGCVSGDLNFRGAQQVNAKSRAEMCAAWTVWKAAAARAKATKDLSAEEFFRAIDLAGPRLARGLDLTERQRQVIDLAFDETKHRRLPKGLAGGGRFAALVAEVTKLKEGQSHTVEASSGTKIKRLTATRFRVERGSKSTVVADPHEAVRKAVRMASSAKPIKRVNSPAMTLSDSDGEPIDLAQSRMTGLYDVAATVKRLRKNPKLKNLSLAEVQRIAAARIARRRVRNRLGITDLKKLPRSQVKALERSGLIGGGKAATGTIIALTLQRGPRKGQTIQVKRTASGWHEVKPHATAGSGRKVR